LLCLYFVKIKESFLMPTSRRLFRFRFFLTLSLVYGCSTQHSLVPEPGAKASSPPTSTQPDSTPEPTTSPISGIQVLSAAEIDTLKASGLVAANNAFGWKLFAQIYAENPTQSHFISPVSAALALNMALQGADGQTLQQMTEALSLEALDPASLRQSLPLLLQKLQRPAEDIALEVANSLWVNSEYPLQAEFVGSVQDLFQARVENLDFFRTDVPGIINSWASEATHGRIPTVLSEPPNPEQTLAYLINAIYFKGTWKYKFDPLETRPQPFYLEDGSNQKVSMMRRFGHFSYLSPNQAFPHQGVKLPYGQDGKVSLYLFVPTTGQNLASLQADLQSVGFDNLLSRFYLETGSLQIPRFQLKQQKNLIPALKALGMTDVFEPSQADLTGMTDVPTAHISGVSQFSYVELNEAGTEAAAITVVDVSLPSSDPSSVYMAADRPFCFLIRDEDTGQILFMGTITQPENA